MMQKIYEKKIYSDDFEYFEEMVKNFISDLFRYSDHSYVTYSGRGPSKKRIRNFKKNGEIFAKVKRRNISRNIIDISIDISQGKNNYE